MDSLLDFFRMILPLSPRKRSHIKVLSGFLPSTALPRISFLLKLNRIGISYASFDKIVKAQGYPQVNLAHEDDALHKEVREWNESISRKAKIQAFESFSQSAAQLIPSLIAPHILGFDDVKKAVCWQLFCPERVHILLLGDPGTGKTDVLRGSSLFAPVSSFGLGSGTSGVGLVAAKKGKELELGLLPLAHKGLCCIDELNLMKLADRGALLNAMEKGFVTYDKGSLHQKIPAEVRILATANPRGDRFIGSNVPFLKKQLPFDPALLSRFHLVFLVRKPDVQQFLHITRSIVNDDEKELKASSVEFIKEYVEYASLIPVSFDKKLEPVITDFFEDVKGREDDLLIELSPRLVLGVVRLCKALARLSLRTVVTHDDVIEVLSVLKRSLVISPDVKSKKV